MRFTNRHDRANRRNRPTLSGPGKLLAPILGLSLATIATAIYLSPVSQATQGTFTVPIRTVTSHSSGRSSSSSSRGSTTPVQRVTKVKIVRTMQPDVIHVTSHSTKVVHSVTTVVPKIKPKYCSDFRWQQDAQVAYLANLSDPWGLDGAAGPNNGDGLACTQLPVDPSRRR